MATTTRRAKGKSAAGVQRAPVGIDVLVAARQLIENPENWCQHELHMGRNVHCACGAIEEATRRLTHNVPSLFDCFISGFRGWQELSNFNDAPHRTHAEVLAAFDKAIAKARVTAPLQSKTTVED